MSLPNDVLIRMENLIEAWQQSDDQRSVFLRCYYMMTRNMVQAVEAGEFHDTTWVRRLLQHFAGYYFDALNAYDHHHPTTPLVWQYAHDAALNPHTHNLQRLLLGVNAHINYDLILALADLLQPEWKILGAEKLLQRQTDHRHVNEVLGQTVDAVQDQIIAPLEPQLKLLDNLLGRVDEWLISRLITQWREEVWENALMMLSIEDSLAREIFRQQIETSTQQKADVILFRSNASS